MGCRSFDDVISDNLLLLYLASKVDDIGRTKIQKLVYLVQCRLGRKGIKTFNYNFYRWNYGPFTEEIFQDGEALVDNSILLDISSKPSEKGFEVLCQCEELFQDNREVLKEVDKLIGEYDSKSLYRIKKAVYDSKVNLDGEIITVEDVPLGEPLDINISDEDAEIAFKINDEWRETLDILLDCEASSSLEKAMEDAHEGRIFTCD